MRLRASLLTVVFAALALPALAADPAQARADYDRLQKWAFTGSAVTLTQPVTFTRDTATITLNSGTVRLMQPVSGRVTGLVFEGDGHFTMTVPDRIEVAQLRRFSRKDITSVDQKFTQLVLRTSDDSIDKAFPNAIKESFIQNSIAANRQNHWLIDLDNDVDAQIVAAMLNPGALQLTAAIKTADFDWLTYDYNSMRREEIQLVHWDRRTAEVWVSLDRAEDRTATGAPAERDIRPASVSHIDVIADLSKGKWNARRVGATEQSMLNGHYTVQEEIAANVDGLVALPLQLYPTAKDVTATDEKGQPLAILRDHVGARSANIKNDVYSFTFTLIFPAPLKANEPHAVTFHYDLETPNYAFGNLWYPTVPDAFDATTAKLELRVAKRNEVR
ncbi:MAG: hypothetical protein QOE82_2995, partial [Thermoanaerobaculia bacterium]|nr:hypothetical protein [Thermoanaerobaculia bacterium]